MIFGLLIVIMCIGFLMFLLGLYEEAVWRRMVYSGTSLMFFLIIVAEAMMIEIPRDTVYAEYGVSALCWVFIFINMMVMFITVFPYTKRFFSRDGIVDRGKRRD